MIRAVTMADVLAARDARAARQTDLRRKHGTPLISFTMNIAGEIKVDAAIRRAFRDGVQRIHRELQRMHAPVLEYVEHMSFTGCEALWAVGADAVLLKARMQQIEESCDLGRLFDIDVIDADGSHLSRNAERPCLICGGPVRSCARNRTHSADELFKRAHEMIDSHFLNTFICRVGEIAQKSLLFEAMLTPKPGLVDCRNSGAHQDMDLFSFAGSACALRPYFEACVRIGIAGANPVCLQYAGLQAEDAMFAAVGVNTHKGAIFALGILCCAMGACGEESGLDAILAKAAALGEYFLRQMKASGMAETGGEEQFRQYGLTGARGEAASGFRSVREIGLPALMAALAKGESLQQAGKTALLALMAHVMDSNIIRRAGMDAQRWVMAEAACLQQHYTDDDLFVLDAEMIRRNISPGGSADLLAVTLFLHFISHEEA